MPVVSRKEVIRALCKFGYVDVRQKGSHVRLQHPTDPNRRGVTIPLHKELAFGTLKRILLDAKVTLDELISVL